jgi:hypothetical protein
MGLFDEFIKNKSNDEIKAKISDLVQIIIADGKIEPNEEKLLNQIARKSGLNETQLKEIVDQVITNPDSIKPSPPTDFKEKITYLLDTVSMMMVDGYIDKREAVICEKAAVKLGFNPSIIPKMVADIVRMTQKNAPRRNIATELDAFMSKN